jgi:peptidoglycan/xylan/chitin deacetylase (PgdA/CDA1 family)
MATWRQKASWAMQRLLIRSLGFPVAFLAAHGLRLSGRRLGLATVYHRVGDPPGDPWLELVPALGTRLFALQLRHLRACFRAVPASELMTAIERRRRGGRIPVAITFDDDLPSHAGDAARLLRQAGLPATFFLSGASLSGPFTFWWERLQAAADRGLAEELVPAEAGPERSIHELGMSVQMMRPAERDALSARLADALGPEPDDAGLRSAQVRALAEAGFEIGFHTRRHDFLPLLDDDALAAAMRDGRPELEELAGRRLEAIAYPHGGFDSRVAAAAEAAGFRFGFTTRHEAVDGDTDPFWIGRLEGTFDLASRFALRLTRALLRRWRAAR